MITTKPTPAQEHDGLLLDAATKLVHERPSLTPRQIIAAIARARIVIRDQDAASSTRLPPVDEQVARIVELAREELDTLIGQPR
jgi:hypothetical protein